MKLAAVFIGVSSQLGCSIVEVEDESGRIKVFYRASAAHLDPEVAKSVRAMTVTTLGISRTANEVDFGYKKAQLFFSGRDCSAVLVVSKVEELRAAIEAAGVVEEACVIDDW